MSDPDPETRPPDPERRPEWLLTDGLGGYASGPVRGGPTRRYHALLVAALPPPLGRLALLDRIDVRLGFPGGDAPADPDLDFDRADFRLDLGLPVWRVGTGGVVLEARVVVPHLRNEVLMGYRLIEGGPVRLSLWPWMHFRPHDAPLDRVEPGPYRVEPSSIGPFGGVRVAADGFPALRLDPGGGAAAVLFQPDPRRSPPTVYEIEARRGYPSAGVLWSPGAFEVDLTPGSPSAWLAASAEVQDPIPPADFDAALRREQARRRALIDPGSAPGSEADPMDAALSLAADQFLIRPAGRAGFDDAPGASGREPMTVIAGYHWFTDWGRDTMISLEGLALVGGPGRAAEAAGVLRAFAREARDGLIPNLFPEGQAEGLYHTADATLWFFHAADRYAARTGDRRTLAELLPTLISAADHHLRGTRFGIGVDPRDGLLRQGAEGYQLTWMDAKVGDWVVTPRRGKAVEINALWYNALRLLGGWLRDSGDPAAADRYEAHAARAHASFNARFWYAPGGHLFDVVDGDDIDGRDDPACRPNQLFAFSLRHPVLDPGRWSPVLRTVRDRLLTPVGLRSLDPGHPDYQPRYLGDRLARDAAYHQGTVWAWLIGPFIDAHLRVHPEDRAGARLLLEGFRPHLAEAGLGTVSEIFDADPPHAPRGCVSQAWSVAELRRCRALTADP